MASTTNNSGISGDSNDLGPDEKWDDETDEQFRVRMEKKKEFLRLQEIERGRQMPPCIG